MADKSNTPQFDLEERLLEYAARIVRLAEALPRTQTGKHVSGQVLRSGTAPMAHHGESQAAESRRDFIHKMKIALKELRETQRWLKLIQRIPLLDKTDLLNPLVKETDELIRIFVASLKTAQKADGP
ncbi:MAG: four helix bundle protein [Planctomycetaceae bacterium]|nr:four helix bundle protein [Planctomycetales bacterium]MCB9922923.1 four helix bundle protein [Planctomycetaceae bacterium]